MALLKEDGSLDIERINQLPFEDYMDEMGSMTQEQFSEYLSSLPVNDNPTPVQAVKVDYGLDDERSGVDAEEYLAKMREKLGMTKS